jgi:hypothetical protein
VRGFLRCLALLPVLVTCLPFGGSERRIAGPYRLEQWEDGATYYLRGPGEDPDGGGGLLEGTVTRIAWTRGVIVARRYANFRGDPDGWMVIDVRARTLTGPLSDSALAARPDLAAIRTMPPDRRAKDCRAATGASSEELDPDKAARSQAGQLSRPWARGSTPALDAATIHS